MRTKGNEINFPKIIEHVSDAVFVKDRSRKYIFVNTAAAKMIGKPKSKIIGKTAEQVFSKADAEKIRKVDNANFQGKKVDVVEQLTKNGIEHYLHTVQNPIKDRNGNIVGISGTVRDVTEESKQKEELMEVKENLSTITDNLKDAIFAKDANRKYTFVNPAAAKMMGLSVSKIIGKTPEQIFSKKNAQKIRKVDNKNFRGKKVDQVENLTINGRIFYLHTVQIPIKGKNGKVIGISGVVRDVTDSHERQKQLEDAKKTAERLLDIAGVMIIALDPQGKVSMINERGCEILGYKRDEIIGKDWFYHFLPKGHIKEVKGVFNKIIEGDLKLTKFYENPILRKDGSQRMIAWHNSYVEDEDGNITGILSSGEDITERKKGEEELKESEHLLSRAQEITHLGHWRLDAKTLKVTGSDELFKIFGFPRDRSTLDDFAKVVHPDDREYDLGMIQRGLKEGKPWDIEHRLLLKNGTIKHVHAIGEVVKDKKGKVDYLIGTVQDITEKKQAEQTLKKSKEIIDVTNHSVITTDLKGIITSANNGACKIFGYSPDELIGHPVSRIYPESSIKELKHTIGTLKQGKSILNIKGRAQRKNKETITMLASFHPLKDERGNVTELLGISRDISKEEEVQMEIKNLQEYLDLQVQRMPLGLIVWDADFKVKSWNPMAEKIFGFKEKEALGKHPYDLIVPKSAQKHVDKIWGRLLEGDKTAHSENSNFTKNGKNIFCAWSNTPLKDGKKVVGVLSMVQDITARKQAQEELVTNEERYRTVFESVKDMIIVEDAKTGEIIDVNKATVDQTGYSKEELMKMGVAGFSPKGPKFSQKKIIEKIKKAAQGKPQTFEWGFVHKNGKLHHTIVHLSRTQFGGDYRLVAVASDVTKQRKFEEQLRSNEEQFRTIFNFSPASTVLWDLSGKIIRCNEMFVRLHKAKGGKDAQVGRNIAEFVSKDQHKFLADRIGQVIKTGKNSGIINFTMMRDDGSTFKAEAEAAPIKNDAGELMAIVGRAKDVTKELEAKQLLEDTKERFEDIANSSGDWIWEVNAQGQYTYASGKVKQILGYSPKELLGKTPFDYMPEEEAAKIGKAFGVIAKGKKPIIDLENWNVTKSGKRVCLLTNGVPLLEDGKLIGYRGVDKDITQSKVAEQKAEDEVKNYELLSKIGIALNASESFEETISGILEQLSESFMLDGIIGFTLDDKTDIARASFSWQRKKDYCLKDGKIDLGSTPSFVKMLKEKGVVLADDIKKLPNDLYIFLKSKKIKSILSLPIKPFRATNGFICFHSIERSRHWHPEEVRVLKIIANMLSQALERRMIREETEAEREKLHKTLYNIGDAVIAVDRDLKVTQFNKVAADITGIKPEQILGKRYDTKIRFVHADNDKKVDQFILDVFATGERQIMHDKTVLIDAQGKKKPIADSAAPLKDARGNIIGCVVVFRDITLEQEIDKMKTEFVSVASHQLRTPLGGIKWFTELLQNESLGKLTTKQKDAVSNIALSNERMITLVKDLLNVSRMEEGQELIIKRKQINICKIIESVIKEDSILAKSRHVTVEPTEECKGKKRIILSVDPKRIEQVIHNILNNAIKYSKRNGKVTVGIKQTPKEATFIIKDYGVGIPKRQQARVFEKFFRADNILTMQTDGTGLGLYICKVIIEAHGGKIWFESEVGKGTTVYFTIPKKTPRKQ